MVFIGGLGRWLLLKNFQAKRLKRLPKHHFWVSCLGSLTYFCWRKDGGKGATFFRDMEGVQRGRVSEILLQKSKFPWDYITSSSLTPEKKNRRYVIEFPFGGAASASCKLFGLGRNSFQMSQLLRNQQPGPTLHRETNLVKQKQWQRKVRCFLRSFFEELYILYLAIESMKWPTMGILMPGAPNTLSEGYLDPKHLPKYPKIHSQSRVLEHYESNNQHNEIGVQPIVTGWLMLNLCEFTVLEELFKKNEVRFQRMHEKPYPPMIHWLSGLNRSFYHRMFLLPCWSLDPHKKLVQGNGHSEIASCSFSICFQWHPRWWFSKIYFTPTFWLIAFKCNIHHFLVFG